jgi:putative addiction module component (TIGR02574 family)
VTDRAQKLLEEALALNPEDRERLAESLWLSLDGASPDEVDVAWQGELERRADEALRGEGLGQECDAFLEGLRARLRRR